MKSKYIVLNYFCNFHPVFLLIFHILTLISILICDYNISLVYTFISFSTYILFLEGIKAYAKSFIYYFILTLLTIIFNVIFNHNGNTPFLYVNDVPLTVESLNYGFYTGIFISSLLLWFKSFNHSFDNGKINYMLGKKLPTIGLIISMTFGFNNKFKYKLSILNQTLYTQGFKPKTIRYGAFIFSLLISVMLEESSTTADSMISRGYITNSKKRTTYKKYNFTLLDFFYIILSLIIFLFSYKIRELNLILILLPLIFNIYKEASWKYYQLKI